MNNPVWVIGMGPGSEEYLTPCALRAIEAAEVLVGGRRWLRALHHLNKEMVVLSCPLEKTIDYIKNERQNKRVAVLVSGDAGIYSLLPRLREALGEEALEVIPGISSAQLAFARLKKNWESARILSLHGRKLEGLEQEIGSAPLAAIFCDASHTPVRIAAYLQGKGVGPHTVYLCQDLSYPEEKIIKTDLSHLAELEASGNFLLIIEEVTNAG